MLRDSAEILGFFGVLKQKGVKQTVLLRTDKIYL